jgi:autotransporter-associated beta strand protein
VLVRYFRSTVTDDVNNSTLENPNQATTQKSMKFNPTLLFLSAIGASSILLAPALQAADIEWTGGGANKNWSTDANWSGVLSAKGGDNVTFDDEGRVPPATVSNIVDESIQIDSLTYKNGTKDLNHWTSVDDDRTLTVEGDFLVALDRNTDRMGIVFQGSTYESTGLRKGALTVNGNSFRVEQTADTTSDVESLGLWMRGLGTLTANLNSETGIFRVSGLPSSTVGAKSSYISLPATSTITANLIGVGDTGAKVATHSLNLGVTTNTVKANIINIGSNTDSARSNGVFNFSTALGSLMLRGADGISPVTAMNLANSPMATDSSIEATANFGGHEVDADITTLTIGRRSAAGNANANATFTSGSSGTLKVGTLNLGEIDNTEANAGTINSIMNISGGNATFGEIKMATSNSSAGTTINSTLNLKGGTTTVNGDIKKVGGGNGSTTATLNLDGGTLDMGGKNIGSASEKVVLNLKSGVLKNVGNINGGDSAGTITKPSTSTGSLILSNVNYSASYKVEGGALVFRKTADKPSGADHTFSANTTLGLGVGNSDDFFTSTDVDYAFSGTGTKPANLSNVIVNPTTNVGIDTTDGDFTYEVKAITTKGLTKFGDNKLTLTGYKITGPTVIDQGILAFGTSLADTRGSLTFGASDAITTAGILDLDLASATFNGLFVNTNSATANEIKIGSDQTLTINGNVTIGVKNIPTTGTFNNLTMTGGGTFNVDAAGGTFRVGSYNGTNTIFQQSATLDLTALKDTTINLSANGSLQVGSFNNQAGGEGVLRLPNPDVTDNTPTTTIIASKIELSEGLSGSFSNRITLGTGLTKLNVGTINVGNGIRDLGQMTFAGDKGDLIIRAMDGISRATAINLATTTNQTTTSSHGGLSAKSVYNTVDFSGHDADILVTSLNVGKTSRTGSFTSEFKFGAGNNTFTSKLDATQVNIGFRIGNGTVASSILTNKVSLSGGTVTFGNGSASGTGVDIGNNATPGAAAHSTVGELNISGGAVTIHNGSRGFAVRLGTNSAAAGALGTVTASMNLTGGTTTLGGHIIKDDVSPRTTSTVKISGGTLDMGGFNIGSQANSITLTAESGTLKNVGEINGRGGLTKTTQGTLTLSGNNTYTGDTIVEEGVLDVTGTSIANTGKLVINGGQVQLTNTETVNTLFIDGVQQEAGYYTSADAPSKFTGTGKLEVVTGPIFSTWITGSFLNGAVAESNQGANDDPDNDGISNLLEYAIAGQDPTVSNPTIGSFNGSLLSFTKRQGASGLTYVIEESTNLSDVNPWNYVGSYTENTESIISYTLDLGSEAKKFARLRVTQNNP